MSASRTVRIGTRASQLAMWQAEHVAGLLRAGAQAPPVQLVGGRVSAHSEGLGQGAEFVLVWPAAELS